MRARIGELVFDGPARQLTFRGGAVHLSPKAWQLLEILLESHPHAVARQDLFDRIWPDVVVLEANLANLVAELRAALVSSGGDPGLIRTIARFGYGLAGEVVRDELGPATGLCLWTSTGPVPLHPGPNLLGRDPTAVVRIHDPRVSRRHAEILVGPDRVTILDLASHNGTFVDGKRVTGAVEIHDGERIDLGPVIAGIFDAADPTRITTDH